MSTPNTFKGTSLLTTATFKVPPETGTLTDPTAVTLKFKCGSDPSTTWVYGGAGSIVKVGVGVYSAIIPTTAPGDTVIQWAGTGTAAAIGVVTQVVSDPPL